MDNMLPSPALDDIDIGKLLLIILTVRKGQSAEMYIFQFASHPFELYYRGFGWMIKKGI